MLDLRDLNCLVALARHRHFARAAGECGMSQPAFSMRIRNLEERLGARIVKRGNRFLGLTPEGETVVAHARRILDGVHALEVEVRAARGEVVGALKLGVVPTAAAFAAQVANRLRVAHPGIRTRIDNATSLGVQQGVDEGRFDAGITYTEGASRDLLQVEALYDERYVLFVPEDLAPAGQAEMSWSEAAALPLILLEPDMQNRRIIDQVFRQVGAQPDVIAETSGFTAAVVMASQGRCATVVPEVMLDAMGQFARMRYLPLVAPAVAKSVSLVTLRRDSRLPVVEALRAELRLGE